MCWEHLSVLEVFGIEEGILSLIFLRIVTTNQRAALVFISQMFKCLPIQRQMACAQERKPLAV